MNAPKTTAGTRIPIACTLEPEAQPDRMADWQRVIGAAAERERIDGGVRLHFGTDATPAFASDLAALAMAEQACCTFFQFALVIDAAHGLALEVRAPEDAAGVIEAVFG